MFECTIIPTNTHVSGRSCRLSVRMFVCAHIYCCNLVEELPSVNYLTSLQSVCKRVYVCVCWVVIWSKKSQVWITWWAFKTFRSRMRVCICVRGFLLKTRVCTSLQVMRLDSFETHVSSGNYLKLEKGVPDFWKMEVSQIWKGGPRLLKNGSVCKSSEVAVQRLDSLEIPGSVRVCVIEKGVPGLSVCNSAESACTLGGI